MLIGEKDILSYAYPRSRERQSSQIGVQALHQASMRLADVRSRSPRFKTRELVGLLLCHGARSWRSSLPLSDIRLSVVTPDGKTAVKIRLR